MVPFESQPKTEQPITACATTFPAGEHISSWLSATVVHQLVVQAITSPSLYNNFSRGRATFWWDQALTRVEKCEFGHWTDPMR